MVPARGVILYLLFCQTAVLVSKITTAKKITTVKRVPGSDSDTTVTQQ